jgi:hypothetical protein
MSSTTTGGASVPMKTLGTRSTRTPARAATAIVTLSDDKEPRLVRGGRRVSRGA